MKHVTHDITFAYQTGKTLYCRVFLRGAEVAWDENLRMLIHDPIYTDTCLSCTEVSIKHIYYVDMPDGLPTGDYDVLVFEQAGGSPAASDPLVLGLEYSHLGRE